MIFVYYSIVGFLILIIETVLTNVGVFNGIERYSFLLPLFSKHLLSFVWFLTVLFGIAIVKRLSGTSTTKPIQIQRYYLVSVVLSGIPHWWFALSFVRFDGMNPAQQFNFDGALSSAIAFTGALILAKLLSKRITKNKIAQKICIAFSFVLTVFGGLVTYHSIQYTIYGNPDRIYDFSIKN